MDRKIIQQFNNSFRGFYKKYSVLIWSIVGGVLGFLLARSLYFADNPLFEFKLLGEVLIGSLIFLLFFYFGVKIVKFIGAWFEKFIVKTFNKVLYDFWQKQSKNIIETFKKENENENGVARLSTTKEVVLDTSAIIDGRIFSVIRHGFMDNVIVVPQNVIDELQRMADKSDNAKRRKGRLGLDNLNEIRKLVSKKRFKVIDLKSKPDQVDQSLVTYCKKNNAKLVTIDFNLNKAAKVAGVRVLNVNQLVNDIKSNLVPGDDLEVKLVQKGKESGQAVGYLEDGTMVVINDAESRIDQTIQVSVEKVLQTDAGKMIFASVKS